MYGSLSQLKQTFGGTTKGNYFLTGAIVLFYTPFVLMVILYSIFLIKLKKQPHPGERQPTLRNKRQEKTEACSRWPLQSLQRVFHLFDTPFQLRGDTSFQYTGQFHFGLPVAFSLNFIVTNYVAYTYVAINPIICLIFSGNYLEALRRLVNCCDAVQD